MLKLMKISLRVSAWLYSVTFGVIHISSNCLKNIKEICQLLNAYLGACMSLENHVWSYFIGTICYKLGCGIGGRIEKCKAEYRLGANPLRMTVCWKKSVSKCAALMWFFLYLIYRRKTLVCSTSQWEYYFYSKEEELSGFLSTICINIVRSIESVSLLCKPNSDLLQMSAAQFTLLKWHAVTFGFIVCKNVLGVTLNETCLCS